jgi:hypothetical protein
MTHRYTYNKGFFYHIKLSAICRNFYVHIWVMNFLAYWSFSFYRTAITLRNGSLDWPLRYSLNSLWFIARFVSLTYWPCLLTIHSYDYKLIFFSLAHADDYTFWRIYLCIVREMNTHVITACLCSIQTYTHMCIIDNTFSRWHK